MTSYRNKILNSYSFYLLYEPRFFSSEAVSSADMYSASPWIPLVWQANDLVLGYTCKQGIIWVRKTIFCSLNEIFKQRHNYNLN